MVTTGDIELSTLQSTFKSVRSPEINPLTRAKAKMEQEDQNWNLTELVGIAFADVNDQSGAAAARGWWYECVLKNVFVQ